MRKLLRADYGRFLPFLLLIGLIVAGTANLKLAQPAPHVVFCGTLGSDCWPRVPLEMFARHLPLLSVALVLASSPLAVLGTYMRMRATAAGGSMIARVLQLAPIILLLVVGLLACLLVNVVWPPAAIPIEHPY